MLRYDRYVMMRYVLRDVITVIKRAIEFAVTRMRSDELRGYAHDIRYAFVIVTRERYCAAML